MVPVCSVLNHITVDLATGDLWLAGHADFKKLIKYHTKPSHTTLSPSQVERPGLAYYVRERGKEGGRMEGWRDGGRRDKGRN